MFGNDLFSARALQGITGAGHRVTGVVTAGANGYGPSGAFTRMAEKKVIPVLFEKDPNAEPVRDLLTASKPDLIICVHLRKLLRPETCALAAAGAINVHPSLLPKYRGLSPMEQTILHGDTVGGISVHQVDEGVDTGKIIIQQQVPVPPAVTLFQLQRILLPWYERLVPEAIGLLSDPKFKTIPQSESGSSFFGPVTRSDRSIGPGNTIAEIDRRVRACTKPGRGAVYENKIIWSARPGAASDLIAGDETGRSGDKEEFVIHASDGILISEDFEPLDERHEQK